MPQLHFFVDSETASRLAQAAASQNVSLSGYIARLVGREVGAAWPDGYLSQVVGVCRDDPLSEPDERDLDDPDL